MPDPSLDFPVASPFAFAEETIASETSVRELARRFRIVSELTSDFAYCFRVEPEGGLTLSWMTESVTRVTSLSLTDINANGWQSYLYQEDFLIVLAQLERLLNGETDISEYRIYGAEGRVIWIRNHAQPVWDPIAEQVTLIYGAAQDITAQKEAEEQRRRDRERIEALNRQLRCAMKESVHRIKNHLQTVTSLILILAMDHGGALPADKVEQVLSHIHAMAAVHTLLTQGGDGEEEATSLSARALLESLRDLLLRTTREHDLRFQVEEIALGRQQAMSLALVVNELVQNAFKHASKTVQVTLTAGEAEVCLEVRDDGDGYPPDFDPEESAGTGLHLVQDLTCSDLQGAVRFENHRDGGACPRLHFPLPESSWSATRAQTGCVRGMTCP